MSDNPSQQQGAPAAAPAAAVADPSATAAQSNRQSRQAVPGPVDVPHAVPDANGKMPLEFLVVDAERRFEVDGKVQNLSFWVFKVLCRARMQEYLNPPLFAEPEGTKKHYIVSGDGSYVDYCAYHRYSSFAWLREQLLRDNPGLMLPPVPDKDSEGTLDKLEDLVAGKEHEKVGENPFIASRMRQLNLFVQHLMPLLQLHSSAHLKAFLSMTEHDWCLYKEKVDKANEKPTTVKSVFAGVGRFFKRIGKQKLPVFDASHPVGRIQARLREFGDAMLICAKHIEQASKVAHAVWEMRPDQGDFNVMAKHQAPPPLLFLSHRVMNQDHLDGTIVHMDDPTGRAYVDWHNNRDPEPVAQNTLAVPPNGILDPVCLLLGQLVGAIDSSAVQLRTREEAAVLRDAVDFCFFLHNWARANVALIDDVAKIEDERREVAEEKAGAKPVDVPALEQQQQELERKFNAGKETLVASYHSFYVPQMRTGIFRVCKMGGASFANMLRTDDWAERLQAPMHLYECRFDEVHPSVAPLLRHQQAQAESMVTMSPQQAGTDDSNRATPPVTGAAPVVAAAAAPATVAPAGDGDGDAPNVGISNESIANSGGVLAPPSN